MGLKSIPPKGFISHDNGTMQKPKIEQVFAANLNRLMESDHNLNTVKKLANSAKVATGTIDRLRRGEVSARLDSLNAIAGAFDLSAWQLLVPGLDPGNPPLLQPVSPAERAWWAKLQELAKSVPN